MPRDLARSHWTLVQFRRGRESVSIRQRFDLVVTELAVIAFPGGRATLVETAPGASVEQILAATEATLEVPERVPSMML